MQQPAAILAPAVRSYQGGIIRPERWATWVPRAGDILVCTPPKCGTTWTQTILAMLVHGGPDLPAKLPVLSPWVDADLGVPAAEVEAALAAQTGRRVVKTHAPADGFPIWDGVTVIAVYRHPLDVFFSLRTHEANRVNAEPDYPLKWPLSRSIRAFCDHPAEHDQVDEDNLASVALHYDKTVLSGRLPDLKLFHYADMRRNGRAAVQALAQAAGIDADDGLIDRVTAATTFGAMKDKAADYAPVAGTGFWRDDRTFFHTASSRKWEGQVSDAEFAHYQARLAELIPDQRARDWLETGAG
jgi:aryl sulfotransferase